MTAGDRYASTDSGGWVATTDALPPERVEVEVMNGPYVQRLVRQGRLWFFPDFSMYVYFTPGVWRMPQSDGRMGERT